ncbi:hypothetical protein B0I35DRAFT_445529 [Stachybotrys elegans]|uniref:SnoaL-like domain-containing protein n=1 Tax=Stachybotrys elegans TaxID=80388 RepID=A0A8K0WKQ6_9HYPO|nr:hypothetical protein B0I35DRAFT_445529 [Stachybotrys elegans]
MLHILTGLTTREAIVDAMSRALSGVDRNDSDLFVSAWAGEEVSFEINGDGEQKLLPNLSVIRKHILGHIGPMDTTHNVSNIRIEVEDGASIARLTATSLAQHCPAGKGKDVDAPKYLVAGEYSGEVIQDVADGVWKLKRLALNVIWKQGDESVINPA